MDDPVLYRVGPETMDDLIKVAEQLGEFLKWLGEKEYLDAALKFAPVVHRIDGLINAILAANEPEFAPWVDLMEKLKDEENAELAKATTPEETLAIESKWEKILDKLNELAKKALAEVEARAVEKKERKH